MEYYPLIQILTFDWSDQISRHLNTIPDSSPHHPAHHELNRMFLPSPSLPIRSHPSFRPKPARCVLQNALIIGGGAAGHLAAISLNQHIQTPTTILESSKSILQKVRISGGGRCNVTSANDAHDIRQFSKHYPRGSKQLLTLLSAFSPSDVRQFFESIGVELKVEPGGKVFPVSDDSATVINALTKTAGDLGILTRTRCRVTHIRRQVDGFEVTLADGGVLQAAYVVIATGGAGIAHKWARELGHRIVTPVPSLFTFGVKDSLLEGLAGLSVPDVEVSLDAKGEGFRQRGGILVTHWGLSGPAVLSLSAFGARELYKRRYHMYCFVDWVPDDSRTEKATVLRDARRTIGAKNVGTVCPFRQIPRRLWRRLVGKWATAKWGELSNRGIEEIVDGLHHTRFSILSKGEFKDEFVTAGGVSLSDVRMKTFESKIVKNLYFAGETLDVDGRTGGYNLEFAWSSGYIAGASIFDRILAARKEEQSVELIT